MNIKARGGMDHPTSWRLERGLETGGDTMKGQGQGGAGTRWTQTVDPDP